MKIAKLDVSGCQYLDELHERIKDTLDFPDYYDKTRMLFGICCGANVMPIK